MFGELFQGPPPVPVPLESKRLRETVQTISHRWVPCNPVLKRRFQSLCLRESIDRDRLFSILLNDPGLCIYVLRSLKRIFPRKDSIQFRTALAEVELDQLVRLLEVPEETICASPYQRASRHQTFGLKRSVFTTTAARVFADCVAVDSFDAEWTAFSRELGYLLLAWSYPHLYNRAMSRQRSTRSPLSQELQNLVGVSPEEIGQYMLKEWRLNLSTSVDSVQSDNTVLGTEEIVAMAGLYARAQDPLYFGQAGEQWLQAKPVVEEVLGANVLSSLQVECLKSFEAHTAYLPLAAREETPVSEPAPAKATDLSALQKSKNYSRLPEEVQQVFADILLTLDDSISAQAGLRSLVNQLVPFLGFKRGCVFSLSKDGSQMFPVLRFGDLPLQAYDEYKFDKYQGMKSLIFQSVPFKRDGIGFAGERVSYLCGGLDSSEYQGVLYLETQLVDEINSEVPDLSLLYFRCLRETLNKTFRTLLS